MIVALTAASAPAEAKYASNTKAAALVARNIRDGGSGKWGSVPMPAFRQLSEAEASNLAHYVLSQGDL